VKYVGIDLHKKSITVCVVNKARQILLRRRLECADTTAIRSFFAGLGPFEAVIEATASYEWLVRLIEPAARRVLLAHPKKLRVIAESVRKSDRLDAQVLAEFLALDLIPTSYRPTPRQRDHRRLVRQRQSLQRRITAVKNRLRRVLSDYNADRPDLFTREGTAYLEQITLSPADRFAAEQLQAELAFQQQQLAAADRQLQAFAREAPAREAEARALLKSIPGVGDVTTEVVLAELADVRRFRSQKAVVAYAGLAPGQRESAGKRQELHLEKNGSRLLRWILVEAAWRLVGQTARWRAVFENLAQRTGRKKAIVAVARRLLGLMVALLQSGQPYQHGLPEAA
jgi:transposase